MHYIRNYNDVYIDNYYNFNTYGPFTSTDQNNLQHQNTQTHQKNKPNKMIPTKLYKITQKPKLQINPSPGQRDKCRVAVCRTQVTTLAGDENVTIIK